MLEMEKAPFPRPTTPPPSDKPLPPPEDINEVRTVRIGGFSFKVGRIKNISRATGKRKDPKKVRQGDGKLFYSVHVSLIMTENI